MIKKEINSSNYRQTITDIVLNKEESLLCGVCGGKVVLAGDNHINTNYAQEKGYDIWQSPTSGGCIVVNKDDVEIDIFRHDGWKDGEKLVSLIVEKLKNLGLNAYNDSNDIMVDKFKVGSYSSKNLGNVENNFIFTGVHLSFSVNLEDIQNICTKEMIKIPKGLLDFGVKQSDILDYILLKVE